MIGDPCSLRFTPDSNRTPKPFRSDSGTYHVRPTVRVVLLSNNFILKYYIMRLYCSIYRIIVVNKNGISFSLCILTQSRARWSSDSVKHGAVSAAVGCCLLQAGFYRNEEKGNILLAESVCAQYSSLVFVYRYFIFQCLLKLISVQFLLHFCL